MKTSILIYICLLPISIQVAYAQSPQTTLEKFKTQNAILQLDNAALLKGIKLPGIGDAQLGYFQDNGSFKHPLDAGKRTGVQFNASRAHSLNNWDFYGSFDFKTYKEKEVAFTSMANPFRDNPYQVADSLSGEWKKQSYDLGLKVATPAFAGGKLVAGLSVNYSILTGARQKDPRPLDYSNQLDLTPGLVYHINPKSRIGLNGAYQNYREDLTVELYNTKMVYNIYKLSGLGEYEFNAPIQLSTGSIVRGFKGTETGGDFQYMYKGRKINLTASVGYRQRTEDVTDGTTYPKKAGQHSFDRYRGFVAMDWSGKNTFNQFVFNWDQRNIDNREYHQVQNSTTKQYEVVYTSIFNTTLKTRSTLAYLFNKLKEDDNLNWTLKVAAGFNGLDNRYANPRSLQIIDRMDASLAFAKYISLKKSAAFSFAVYSGYDFAFTHKLEYTDKDYSSNYVARHIFIPSHDFLSASSWNNQLNVQYTFERFAKSGNQVYIKGTGYVNTAMSDKGWIEKGNTRQGFQFSIGLYN